MTENFISRWILRAESSVGVITLLLSITAFGIGHLLGGISVGTAVALIAFGLTGSVEVFHIQATAKANQRSAKTFKENTFFSVYDAHPKWNPKIIKEFNHGGFIFRSIGFDELEIPLNISNPLCPTCHNNNLLERIEVVFPGRIKIEHMCTCGFTTPSKYTFEELRNEASQIAALPE